MRGKESHVLINNFDDVNSIYKIAINKDSAI
jgi:hypothetical protein